MNLNSFELQTALISIYIYFTIHLLMNFPLISGLRANFLFTFSIVNKK